MLVGIICFHISCSRTHRQHKAFTHVQVCFKGLWNFSKCVRRFCDCWDGFSCVYSEGLCMQLSPGGSCRGTGSVWLCNSNHSLLIQFLLCYIISDVILQTRNIHWKCFSFVTWRTACYGWGQLLSWRLRSGLITACINSATRLGGNWFQQKHPHTSEAAWYCRRTERPPHTSPLQARLTSRLRADWLGVGACSWFE